MRLNFASITGPSEWKLKIPKDIRPVGIDRGRKRCCIHIEVCSLECLKVFLAKLIQ